MQQAEFEQHVGKANICASFHAALERAIIIQFNTGHENRVA
jgi:hypothetical protein